MAGFNAEGIVEPLEYTLKPYVDAAGVIKEPTSLQVHTFRTETLRESQRFRREVGEDLGLGTDSDGEETLTADQMLAIMEKQGPERSAAALKRQADMYSALCSGKPTPLQLQKLPHRVMLAFAQWLNDELINPEASAGAGNVTPIRSKAAG